MRLREILVPFGAPNPLPAVASRPAAHVAVLTLAALSLTLHPLLPLMPVLPFLAIGPIAAFVTARAARWRSCVRCRGGRNFRWRSGHFTAGFARRRCLRLLRALRTTWPMRAALRTSGGTPDLDEGLLFGRPCLGRRGLSCIRRNGGSGLRGRRNLCLCRRDNNRVLRR